MKRFMGLMPSESIEISRDFKDAEGRNVHIDAGPEGWTILYPGNCCDFEDVNASSEENFTKAFEKANSISKLTADEKCEKAGLPCNEERQNNAYYKLLEDEFDNDIYYAAEYAEEEDAELIFDETCTFIKKAYIHLNNMISTGLTPSYYWMGYLCTNMHVACTLRQRIPELHDDIIDKTAELLKQGTSIIFENEKDSV